MFIRNPMPEQLDPALVAALGTLGTSTLGHMRDHGFPRGLSPVRRPLRFVGTAVTVRIPHLDSTAVHVAADSLRPGDVIVVEQNGDENRSCFGGMVSHTAHARGAVGAVIEGCINDIDDLDGLGFPVFSRGISSLTTRIAGIEGAINVPVTIGGAIINPGDAIMADSDGIAVISPDEAWEIVAKLRAKEEREGPLKLKISAGDQLSNWTRAREVFEANEVPAVRV
ncbi:RraA family protein [Paeniglutamicibacter sp. MACA_103]|uniref:RraA family protein n=1 Tax=Paeniglutamicibacter sp. MACA_103 TaxID=3377337 RepID=UPI0038956BFE